MRFAYYLPGRWVPENPALTSGPVIARLARAAEAAGFSAIALDEHPAPSKAWREGTGGHDCLDPFVGLAMVAGATTRIQLFTYLAVLPYRNPFLFAKQAATLDVVSDGRLLLGVGLGYMKDEFTALGADFDRRHEVFDETLELAKRAWTGEPVTHEGVEVVARPAPVQRPHPPIWVGGNGRRTLRRVVAAGQGWLAMPVKKEMAAVRGAPPLETAADLAGYVARLHRYAEEAGRTDPIDVVHSLRDIPQDWSGHLDGVRELAEAGVTWAVLNPPNEGTAPEAERYIEEYGEKIIAAVTTAGV